MLIFAPKLIISFDFVDVESAQFERWFALHLFENVNVLKKSKVLSLRGDFNTNFENMQKWYKNDVFLGFATPHMIGHVVLIRLC